MEIYLIRHGQTLWNKEFRWQGSMDTDLDDIGLGQAALVAQRLLGCDIMTIYTSPLKRARVTAGILGRVLRLEPFLHEDLREVAFGHWEGLTLSEIREFHAEQLGIWESEPEKDPGGGIESFKKLSSRATTALNDICDRHSNDETIAIVTHGAWVRALILYILNIPLDRRLGFDLDNAGVSILRYDVNKDRLKIKTLNECSFLYRKDAIHA